MSGASGVFVSWIHYHGRSQELAERVGLSPFYVTAEGPAVTRYIVQAFRTWQVLRDERPKVIGVMLPPTPLLLMVKLFAVLHHARILADFHTGAFLDRKWAWALGISAWVLTRNDLALVTNTVLANRLRKRTRASAKVVHDVIAPDDSVDVSLPTSGSPVVLVPLSYASDEPVGEIVAAARSTPELRWILTGNAPSEVVRSASSNVEFPGFIPRARYVDLMRSATVFAAVTTRAHTMQRVGYEALALRKPLVTSDFPELREFFADAALYSAPTAAALSSAVKEAVESHADLHVKSTQVRAARINEQNAALNEVAAWVGQDSR